MVIWLYSNMSNLCYLSLIDFVAQMLVYSLGMTLYWSVDFHLPQNQVGSPDGCLQVVFFLTPITIIYLLSL